MASMPIDTLRPIYKDVWSNEDSLKRMLLSNANVEKVVKPPQKPVANSKVWFSEM